MNKKPSIAALLNVIAGLGYIYVGGRRTLFGVLLLAAFSIGTVWSFDPEVVKYLEQPNEWRVWFYLSAVLSIAAFVYDGYQYALDANQSRSKKRK